jgi:prepilin-type N-terminal cleavage/methylation domain-containing protein
MNMKRTNRRCGFTLVELLAVIGIIVVLMSLLLVALAGARRGAMTSQTTRQLASMSAAMDAFKSDFGWYPPLLVNNNEQGDPEELLDNDEPMHIVPQARYRYGEGQYGTGLDDYRTVLAKARYHSTVSIAQYLIGAGDLNGDEIEVYDQPGTERIEPNFDDGADGPGIRHPGAIDKSWGGGADRMLQVPRGGNDEYPDGTPRLVAEVVPPRGRVYGPYLDPGLLSDRLRRRKDGMFEIEDSFGVPIRYYRGFPTKEIAQNTRDLRVVPIELRSFDSFEAQENGDLALANDLDRELLGAEFVLLSAGASGTGYLENADREAFPQRLGDPAGGSSEPDFEFLPPFGDFVRDDASVLQEVQPEWGDIAGLDEMGDDYLGDELQQMGMNMLTDSVKTNVRSVR